MLTILEYARVVDKIHGLWPRYDFPEELQRAQYEYLRTFDVEDVLEALAQHHRENPDGIYPKWKQVMAWWRDHVVKATSNEWQSFINCLRSYAISQKQKGCQNMSDQDLFMGFLAANCHQHDYQGRPIPDPDGHRARLARWFRYAEGRRWTTYLQSIGAEVPDWLFTERDDTVSCCSDEQREKARQLRLEEASSLDAETDR